MQELAEPITCREYKTSELVLKIFITLMAITCSKYAKCLTQQMLAFVTHTTVDKHTEQVVKRNLNGEEVLILFFMLK